MPAEIKTVSISSQGRTEDFMFQLARRKVANHASVTRFGRNPSVGTTSETIWEYGGLFNYLDAAIPLQISSSSVNDTDGGTGVRKIQIVGLGDNFSPFAETVTMNGRTPVTTVRSFRRVLRVYGLTCGSVLTNDGDIYVHNSTVTNGVPDTASLVYSSISTGNGQTEQAVHTVPAGFTGYITAIRFNAGRASNGATMSLFTRTNVSVSDNGSRAPFRLLQVVDLVSSQGTSIFAAPLQVGETTDIEARGFLASGSSALSASFDLVLVREVDSASATIPAILQV